MPKIILSDKSIGSCVIEYKKTSNESKELTLKKELTIKALAALQLIVISRTNETESDFNKIIDVLQETISEIEKINETEGENNEFFGNYYN